jgi:hypothetical protein
LGYVCRYKRLSCQVGTCFRKPIRIAGERSPALGLNIGVPKGGIYRTNDVFEETPPTSGKWIYIGRRDLMLVHSSGFLTNPLPCESALRPLEEIAECQLVGHERRGPLLLVELN